MNYWVLKTRRENNRDKNDYSDFWNKFIEEKVIAIGWSLPIKQLSPVRADAKNEIVQHLLQTSMNDFANKKDPKKSAQSAAEQILKFKRDMQKEDKVFFCKGYTANYGEKVLVYGYANKVGALKYCKDSKWFKLKRPAEIIEKKVVVPKTELVEALGLSICLHTITRIDKDHFEKVVSLLNKYSSDVW